MSSVQMRTVTEDESGMRLDRWFRRHFPHISQGQLQKLLRTGQVRLDGRRVEASTRLEKDQTLRVPPLPEQSLSSRADPGQMSSKDIQKMRDLILYQDDDVMVINKPAGLAVQGGTGIHHSVDSMLEALRFDEPEKPRLVHRLDRDTSGVLVLARTLRAARDLGHIFRSRDVRKYYWAVTVGVPQPFQGRINLALSKQGSAGHEKMAPDDEGKSAMTYYQVVEAAGKQAAWVALWPVTGRTHQLRVHMAAIGTPLLGDVKYGEARAFLSGTEDLPRQLHLHARQIVFPHPRRGMVNVKAPLSSHMKKTWSYFNFHMDDDGDPFASLT